MNIPLKEPAEQLRNRFKAKWNIMPEEFERKIINSGTPLAEQWYPTIIIPSFKCPEYLELCLNGIFKNSSIPYEIAVSIQEDDEESRKLCLHAKNLLPNLCKQFKVISTDKDALSSQINLLARVAETNWIFYIHDDMYPMPQWLERMGLMVAGTIKPYMYLTPTLIEPVSEDGTHPNFVIRNYGETRKTFKQDLIEKEWITCIERHKRPCPPGGWAMNTNSFLETKGKDEQLYLYGEDSEYMIRLFKMTQDPNNFVQVGDCLLYHFSSKSGEGNWNKRPDDQINEFDYIDNKHGISIGDFEWKILERGRSYSDF